MLKNPTIISRALASKQSARCLVRYVDNATHTTVSHSDRTQSLQPRAAASLPGGFGHSMEDLLQNLRASGKGNSGPGEVFLVGTGPGDPGLLTLRGVLAMQEADVILYDRLVSPEILDMVNKSAIMVYVGKNRGFHTRTQTEIHELLCDFAQEGAKVVRLKGGDPFIFGRGGEEMVYLQERGITVHTVPGITAAAGISAELGIPLTHRGLATGCAFITGHAREGGQDLLDDSVSAAVDSNTTLIVYMGLNTLPALLSRLAEARLSDTTPCAAIERGTTAQQRGVYTVMRDLTKVWPRLAPLGRKC